MDRWALRIYLSLALWGQVGCAESGSLTTARESLEQCASYPEDFLPLVPWIDWRENALVEGADGLLVSAEPIVDERDGAGWQEFEVEAGGARTVWRRRTVGGLVDAASGEPVKVNAWGFGRVERGVILSRDASVVYVANSEDEYQSAVPYERTYGDISIRGLEDGSEWVDVLPDAETTCERLRAARIEFTVDGAMFVLSEGEVIVGDDWVLGVSRARIVEPDGCRSAGSNVAFELAKRRW